MAKDKEFLLSICIPTYNRPQRIKKSLENYDRILGECNLREKVEICVSDNSTDDKTQAAADLVESGGIVYSKNAKNLGFDKNVYKVLSMGRGKYLHLVSDEDLYMKEFLLEILDCLEKDAPDCIVSYAHMRKYMPYADRTTSIYGLKKGEFMSRMFSLPSKGMMFFGLLSCVIMKRAQLETFARKFGAEKFYGFGYMHVPIYLNAVKESENVVLIRELFRRRENVDAAGDTPSVIAFPSDQLKFVHRNYFHTVKTAHKIGLISDAEWDLFSKNFFKFGLINMLEVRTYIYPGLIDLEFPKCSEWLDQFSKNYELKGMKLLLFNAYRSLVFNRYVPYFLIYAAWAYYRRKIKRDIDVADAHKDYKECLEGRRKFDNLDARTYETGA